METDNLIRPPFTKKHLDEGNKHIGILMWHYKKKKWVFEKA
jgi:hypothetical protein